MKIELTQATILAIFTLLLPEAISVKVYRQLVPAVEREIGNNIIDYAIFSYINLIFIDLVKGFLNPALVQDSKVSDLIVMVVVAFVIPVAVYYVQDKHLCKWFTNPTPSAWDFFFKQRKSCFVKVHLSGGGVVAGYFSSRSYATSFPNEGDLYLEKAWSLDVNGDFDKEVFGTNGVLIKKGEYTHVDLFIDS